MAALLAGKTPTSTITDQPYCIGNWCPKNYGGGYYGRVTLLEAIARSLNSVPVQLAAQIGRDRVAGVARQFGIDLPAKPDWPFVIGAFEVHMIDHAAGYAVFASGGYKIEPYAIEEIRSTSGRVLYDRSRQSEPPPRIFPPDKIAELNSMLYNAVETGTGQRAKLTGIPAGGKTGTTQSSRDAWFCGFTGNMVGVVWVGNDDYTPMQRVTGGMMPAPIWHEVMEYAHQNIELKQAPGMPPPRKGGGPAVAGLGKGQGSLATPPTAPQAERPKSLSAKSIGVLTEIERRLDAATKPVPAPAKTGRLEPLVPAGGGLTRLAEAGSVGGLMPLGRERLDPRY
jgi:penicillin-binding protein 1A